MPLSPHSVAIAAGLRAIRRIRGVEAEYERDGQATAVTLVPHTADRVRERDDHLQTREATRSYLLEAVELEPLADLLTGRIEPDLGDQLVIGRNTDAEERFELLPVASGEDVAVPHDTAGVFWRLTCKRLT